MASNKDKTTFGDTLALLALIAILPIASISKPTKGRHMRLFEISIILAVIAFGTLLVFDIPAKIIAGSYLIIISIIAAIMWGNDIYQTGKGGS